MFGIVILCQTTWADARAAFGYTEEVPATGAETGDRPSLRAEQVAQTRAALVAAGRRLFGEQGFAATSVEDVAREARVTTGALYHHFPTKTALFESVFEQIHAELLNDSAGAALAAEVGVEQLLRGSEAFLDAVLRPDVARILVIDAPSVLGLARFTEMDERYAVAATVLVIQAAVDASTLEVDEPETLARLWMGVLTRGGMLIANSPDPAKTRDDVARAMRGMLAGLARRPRRSTS
jgi:AcrR family transcriptional regulator